MLNSEQNNIFLVADVLFLTFTWKNKQARGVGTILKNENNERPRPVLNHIIML